MPASNALQDITLEQAAAYEIDASDVPMERSEAEWRTRKIREGLETARVHLWKVKQREGWRALGYTSMHQYIIHEFPIHGSTSQAYRQIAAAEVEAIALPDSQIGVLPESALRPLYPYRKDPETLHTLVAIAQRVAGEDRVTNVHIQATVDVMEEAISTGLLTSDEGQQTEVWQRLEHQVLAVMAERTKVHRQTVKTGLANRNGGKQKHYIVDVDVHVTEARDGETFLRDDADTLVLAIRGNDEAMHEGQHATLRLLVDDVP